MYLSRIQITPDIAKNTQLGRLLGDRTYGVHRLLWDLFEKEERFLFREENTRDQLDTRRRLPLYYVLSTDTPKNSSPILKVDTKPFRPQLSKEQRLQFSLRANPVVTRKGDGKKRSARHDVLMDMQKRWLSEECQKRSLHVSAKKSELKRELLQHPDFNKDEGEKLLSTELKMRTEKAASTWLLERGEKHGFSISEKNLQINAYRWHPLPEKNRQAGFSSVDYEGILTIKEPESFLKMIYGGLGPAKAFGCGLMLIRRI